MEDMANRLKDATSPYLLQHTDNPVDWWPWSDEAFEEARRRDVPVQFLEQLFAVLRRAGVLRSQRGVKGGYSFARSPVDITVLELVELLDGPVGGGATGVFAEAAGAARSVLAQSTVADIADAESEAAGAPMYHI